LGRTDTATLTITVSGRPTRPCPSATWNETVRRWDADPCDENDDGDDEESCYDDHTERAEEWESRHPDKEFACYNDVWFGGQSRAIVNTDEDDDFSARGVEATIREARDWTDHPDVSIETDSGFDRLNFHTHEVWRNVKKYHDPSGESPERDPIEEPGDDPGEKPDDDPGNEDPEEEPGDDCDKIPPRYRPPECRGEG
jgi:hypothetical protein